MEINSVQGQEIPREEEQLEFWESMWSYKGGHNNNTAWLKDERKMCQQIPAIDEVSVTEDDVKIALIETPNW